VGWNPRSSRAARWRLGRTRALLRLAGSPQRAFTAILIAGTKGKGSTAAFLASILAASGRRTGLFSSPHLQDLRERFRVDGEMLARADFVREVEGLRPLVRALHRSYPEAGDPTTFELMLVMAASAFARAGCAFGVFEVGLGGRLDATNALDPAISIVTTIGLDHTAILGTTLGAIATEKAGILRRARPAFLAPQRPAAMLALRARCRAIRAHCVVVAPLGPRAALALRGAHQRTNAALAVAAARALGAEEAAIRAGLARLRWPGRYEIVGDRGPRIVLDGAHDGASATALASELRNERAPVTLLVGILRDKDAHAVLRPLLAVASRVIAVAPPSPRALRADELAERVARLGRVPVEVAPDVRTALARARRGAGTTGVVCVTGSLALVGAARTALGLAPPRRLWAVSGARSFRSVTEGHHRIV